MHNVIDLRLAAKLAARDAYCPYSRFPVGAAVESNGQVFTGCNIENASYGLTMCAERVALFSAFSNGARNIKTIVVYTPTKMPHTSCGACRQVFLELCPDAELISFCDSAEFVHLKVTEWLVKHD